MKLLAFVLVLVQLWVAQEVASNALDTTGLPNFFRIKLDDEDFTKYFNTIKEEIAFIKVPNMNNRPYPHKITKVHFAGRFKPKPIFFGTKYYFVAFELERLQDCNTTFSKVVAPDTVVHLDTVKCDPVWT